MYFFSIVFLRPKEFDYIYKVKRSLSLLSLSLFLFSVYKTDDERLNSTSSSVRVYLIFCACYVSSSLS